MKYFVIRGLILPAKKENLDSTLHVSAPLFFNSKEVGWWMERWGRPATIWTEAKVRNLQSCTERSPTADRRANWDCKYNGNPPH